MTDITILQDLLESRIELVEDWFEAKFLEYPAVLSSSVDIRNSGYKISPIDVNFFPAGYNNLGNEAKKRTAELLLKNLSKYSGRRVLIIIEGHTRNKKYVDSVIVLRDLLNSVGFCTEIGGLAVNEYSDVDSSCGAVLRVQQIINHDGQLQTVSSFVPDIIVLNNDLTSGIPEVLQGKIAQKVVPSPHLGWFNRRKSRNLKTYARLVSEFSNEFGIDPWLISALFSHCDEVDFLCRKGMDRIAHGVDTLISEIREKFTLHGIHATPYVFIKADNGTYGRGIITVCSGDDVLQINKKNRNKMRCVKERNPIKSVVLQEGVPTSEEFTNLSAEPLLYYIGQDLACYLYRYNVYKSTFENLNVPGCGFVDIENMISAKKKLAWYAIGKLAVLAAAIESSEIAAHFTEEVRH